MSVPGMEGNLTGVPQQATMNKMKNGGFAQMLVRCCFSLPPRVPMILMNNSSMDSILEYKITSIREECLF